jgi:FlaA1/EpsC-like NDP-sugar epimerase/lipopolysaccharide/colanic/teichoic acid biosynthesis glycosyltransferase
MFKEVMYIIFAILALIITLPFFLLIALLIKMDSKGPILYLCDRVGKDGKLFKMFKFRTMFETPIQVGTSLSPQGDIRVTTIGRLLNRTKLNELPNLINVLKGDMTLVGPRPEAPDLAALYPKNAQKIFSVKPGVLGPNQILGRNEEEWYPPGVDVKKYYIEHILPRKLQLDLEYIQNSSLLTDLKYLFLGIKETLTGALSQKHIAHNRSQIYLLIADLTLSTFSYALAYYFLRFKVLPPEENLTLFFKILPVVVSIRIICFIYFGLYNTLIRHLSYTDIFGVFKGVTLGSIFLLSFTFFFNFNQPRAVFIIDWGCLILLLTSLRFAAIRLLHNRFRMKEETDHIRVFIFGAGDAGDLVYQYLTAQKEILFEIVGFIDDDPKKRHKTIHGKPVLGNRFDIKALVKLYQAEEVILALPSNLPHELTKIIKICQKAGVKYRVLANMKEAHTHNQIGFPLRAVSLSDLLPSHNVGMDYSAVRTILEDKTILITGAGGALGLELCRQILSFNPKKLIIIEQYESYLTELISNLLNTFPEDLVIPIMNATDETNKLTNVFAQYRPELIFHTTMRKYFPFFNIEGEDIIRSNYSWTLKLAQAAANFGCEYFVTMSSLEAFKGNFIGDSLRVAEVALNQFFKNHRTKLVLVRLCDIIENRGGIISVLENQIKNLEAVTLPYHQTKRYFLSKYAATEFILQAIVLTARKNSDGDIFVCQNGSLISLWEVAEKLATLYGLNLQKDLAIKHINYATQGDQSLEQMVLENHQRLIPTSHKNIVLLKEDSSQHSAELQKRIKQYLDSKKMKYEDWEMGILSLLPLVTASRSTKD